MTDLKLYADVPARRTVQVVVDLAALTGVLLGLWLAVQVDDGVDALGRQALRAESAGESLAGGLVEAGDGLGEMPLVGDDVREPFDRAADASDGLATSAAETARSIDVLGTWLGVGVGLLAAGLVGACYLPARVRFVRTATAVRRLRQESPPGRGDDLLALRALVHQPLHVLAHRVPDAADGWRRDDPATVRALAALELRAGGVLPGDRD